MSEITKLVESAEIGITDKLNDANLKDSGFDETDLTAVKGTDFIIIPFRPIKACIESSNNDTNDDRQNSEVIVKSQRILNLSTINGSANQVSRGMSQCFLLFPLFSFY